MLDRSSSVATVVVHEMQDDHAAYHHVNNLSRNTSNEETATSIEKSHIAAIARGRNTRNCTSGDLDENAREVCADEDVRVPLGFEFGVLLTAVEDDVLKHDGDGG